MSRLGVLVVAVVAVGTARADTITVDRIDDPSPAAAACTGAANDCSLRGAVQLANGAPATEIDVPAATYALAEPLEVTGAIAIVGAGASTTVLDGGSVSRLLIVRGAGSAIVSKVTLAHGSGSGSDADGGAVKNLGTLSLVDAVIRDSASTVQGGGISNSGTLVLTRTVVSGNTAATDGGGIWSNTATLIARDSTLDDNHATAESGGAIASLGSSMTMLTGCTLSANSAGTVGGALFNADFGTTTLTNSTVSGNTAGASGGGIDAAGGTVTLANVTVTANTGGADQAGFGGGLTGASGTLIAQNSIVAGNHDLAGGSPDCAGTIISQGYDLIGNAAGCAVSGNTNNLIGQDPQLGPLTDNGGLTKTHLPGGTSPVVDAADPTAPGSGGTSCPEADQRAVTRPQPSGGRCDIGAVEVESATPTTVTTSTTETSTTSTTIVGGTTSTTSSTVVAETTTTSSTSTSSTMPPPVEICDDCIDNDGDGLTDLEDPTCCPTTETVVLELGTARFTPGKSGTKFALSGQFSQLTFTGSTSTQDVSVQLREDNRGDFFCARVPAENLVRHGSKETFKDPKHLVTSAKGIDALLLKRRKNGGAVVKASGKRVAATLPQAGTLWVTVGVLQPGAAEAANRCAIVGVPFTVNRKGALLFHNP